MKRRGIVILGIVFVMSMQLMGTNAQTILRKAREDYYKQQAAAEKAEKEKEKIEKERAASEARAQRESERTQRVKGNEKKAEVSKEEEEYGKEEVRVELKEKEGEYPKLNREKEPKPKNEMERSERTATKAVDRVDFYERVVRSVAREEKDLKEYNEVLGKKKTKYNKVPKVTGLDK